jgi:hypothetical protein
VALATKAMCIRTNIHHFSQVHAVINFRRFLPPSPAAIFSLDYQSFIRIKVMAET